MALDPAGGQRVGNRVAVLVRYMVSEFVEDSIVHTVLAEKDSRVYAYIPTRDQLIVDDREAATTPHFAVAANEKVQ